jgi:hypothetical protein
MTVVAVMRLTTNSLRRVGLVVNALVSISRDPDSNLSQFIASWGKVLARRYLGIPSRSSVWGRGIGLGWGLPSSVRLQGRSVARLTARVCATGLACHGSLCALLHASFLRVAPALLRTLCKCRHIKTKTFNFKLWRSRA